MPEAPYPVGVLHAFGRRARQAVRDPRWAISVINTRLQWQRRLGLEPPEFRRLAGEVLRGIEGWRFRQDLALLYLLARDVPGPGVILEIGSYKGLATVTLAFGAREGHHEEKVHTVDPHTGDRQAIEAGGEQVSSLADFRRNLATAGVLGDVEAYTMTSDELAERWKAGPIRVLFIDGWHSYEAVKSDIQKWVPRLTPDGVVLIDDYRNYDEVKLAVEDAQGLLPQRQRLAGRMWLGSPGQLSPAIERFLRIPWG